MNQFTRFGNRKSIFSNLLKNSHDFDFCKTVKVDRVKPELAEPVLTFEKIKFLVENMLKNSKNRLVSLNFARKILIKTLQCNF